MANEEIRIGMELDAEPLLRDLDVVDKRLMQTNRSIAKMQENSLALTQQQTQKTGRFYEKIRDFSEMIRDIDFAKERIKSLNIDFNNVLQLFADWSDVADAGNKLFDGVKAIYGLYNDIFDICEDRAELKYWLAKMNELNTEAAEVIIANLEINKQRIGDLEKTGSIFDDREFDDILKALATDYGIKSAQGFQRGQDTAVLFAEMDAAIDVQKVNAYQAQMGVLCDRFVAAEDATQEFYDNLQKCDRELEMISSLSGNKDFRPASEWEAMRWKELQDEYDNFFNVFGSLGGKGIAAQWIERRKAQFTAQREGLALALGQETDAYNEVFVETKAGLYKKFEAGKRDYESGLIDLLVDFGESVFDEGLSKGNDKVGRLGGGNFGISMVETISAIAGDPAVIKAFQDIQDAKNEALAGTLPLETIENVEKQWQYLFGEGGRIRGVIKRFSEEAKIPMQEATAIMGDMLGGMNLDDPEAFFVFLRSFEHADRQAKALNTSVHALQNNLKDTSGLDKQAKSTKDLAKTTGDGVPAIKGAERPYRALASAGSALGLSMRGAGQEMKGLGNQTQKAGKDLDALGQKLENTKKNTDTLGSSVKQPQPKLAGLSPVGIVTSVVSLTAALAGLALGYQSAAVRRKALGTR